MLPVGVLSAAEMLAHRLGGVEPRRLRLRRLGETLSQDILTEADWHLIVLCGMTPVESLRAAIVVWLGSLLLDGELVQYLRVCYQAVYALVLG